MQVATILSGQGGAVSASGSLNISWTIGLSIWTKKANPYVKINSNWIKYLNVKGYKAFRKYIEVYRPDFRVGKDFFKTQK